MEFGNAKRPVLVVGCGIIGLTTAIRLHEAGHEVVIYTKETPSTILRREASPLSGTSPSQFASVTGGGLWAPSGIEDASAQEWAATTYSVLKSESDKDVGVKMVEGYALLETENQPQMPWFSKLTQVSIETAGSDKNVPSTYKSAYKYASPVVDMDKYMSYLEGRAVQMGITTEIAGDEASDNESEQYKISAFATSKFPGRKVVIVNCSGMGAAAVSGQDMKPVRGVVVRVKRPSGVSNFFMEDKSEADALAEGFCRFGVPHGDEYLLGASRSTDNTSTSVTDSEVEQVLEECKKIIPGIDMAQIISPRVGFRPSASSGMVHIGLSSGSNIPGSDVIENFGHGGRGLTLCWGCAERVVDVVNELGIAESVGREAVSQPRTTMYPVGVGL